MMQRIHENEDRVREGGGQISGVSQRILLYFFPFLFSLHIYIYRGKRAVSVDHSKFKVGCSLLYLLGLFVIAPSPSRRRLRSSHRYQV